MTCVFDRDILAHEAANILGVVCTNLASGTMDHTKGVDATMQETEETIHQNRQPLQIVTSEQHSKIHIARTSVPK